jgi:hypothetical protein
MREGPASETSRAAVRRVAEGAPAASQVARKLMCELPAVVVVVVVCS